MFLHASGASLQLDLSLRNCFPLPAGCRFFQFFMDFLKQFIEFLLHAENHLVAFIQNYGALVYALLFLIVFCETGLVVTPFLPGDSLLFAVGALTAQGLMAWEIVVPVLLVAAILGDTVNYSIGKWIGPKSLPFSI